MNLSSTCKQVTELSCAHNRWIVSKVERSKTITRPSEPPVIKVGGVAGADAEEGDEGRRTSWPTREVWPWSRARNSLQILVNWRVSSKFLETKQGMNWSFTQFRHSRFWRLNRGNQSLLEFRRMRLHKFDECALWKHASILQYRRPIAVTMSRLISDDSRKSTD